MIGYALESLAELLRNAKRQKSKHFANVYKVRALSSFARCGLPFTLRLNHPPLCSMECSLRSSLLALALVVLPSFAYAGSWTQSGDRIAMGYFAVHDNFTVSDIPWEGYNAMAFE